MPCVILFLFLLFFGALNNSRCMSLYGWEKVAAFQDGELRQGHAIYIYIYFAWAGRQATLFARALCLVRARVWTKLGVQ